MQEIRCSLLWVYQTRFSWLEIDLTTKRLKSVNGTLNSQQYPSWTYRRRGAYRGQHLFFPRDPRHRSDGSLTACVSITGTSAEAAAISSGLYPQGLFLLHPNTNLTSRCMTQPNFLPPSLSLFQVFSKIHCVLTLFRQPNGQIFACSCLFSYKTIQSYCPLS
jgi:hypothetical protein